MKTLVFSDSTGVHVELLTDLIDGNESFTVYQIQERVGGELQIGLTDATIAKGFDFTVDTYGVGEMIEFARDNNYTLVARETGNTAEIYYQGTYYGDSIGGVLV